MTVDAGRVVHFAIGPRRFAFPMSEVAEVAEIQLVEPVPLAPREIAGVAEVRGRIVTLVDLGGVFGLTSGAGERRLGILFAEPLAHLGVLLEGRIEEVMTDPVPLEKEEDSGTESAAPAPEDATTAGSPAPAPVAESSTRSSAAPFQEEESHEPGPGPAGRGFGEDLTRTPTTGDRAEPAATPGADDLSSAAAAAAEAVGSAGDAFPLAGSVRLVSGGIPALVLVADDVARYCTERVRERFRVAF